MARLIKEVPTAAVNSTPTNEILKNANKHVVILDEATGRQIEIKRFSYLDYIRLGSLISQGTQSEPTNWMIDRLLPVACVVSIDGDACHVMTYRDLEYLADRLGFTGIQTIAQGIIDNFPEMSQSQDEIKKKSTTEG